MMVTGRSEPSQSLAAPEPFLCGLVPRLPASSVLVLRQKRFVSHLEALGHHKPSLGGYADLLAIESPARLR